MSNTSPKYHKGPTEKEVRTSGSIPLNIANPAFNSNQAALAGHISSQPEQQIPMQQTQNLSFAELARIQQNSWSASMIPRQPLISTTPDISELSNNAFQHLSALPTHTQHAAQQSGALRWDRYVEGYTPHNPPYAYGKHTMYTHNSADRRMVQDDTTQFSTHRIKEVLPLFTQIFGPAEQARVVEWRSIPHAPVLPSDDPGQVPIKLYRCRTSKAIQVLCQEPYSLERGSRKVCALNFASAKDIGGIWDRGSTQQEESLCMRSDLFESLTLQKKAYPIPEDQLLYTDKVRFFVHEDLTLRKSRNFYEASIISFAAQYKPVLRGDDYLRPDERQRLFDQLCAIPRVAARFGATHLILGAFGCGVYYHPPA